MAATAVRGGIHRAVSVSGVARRQVIPRAFFLRRLFRGAGSSSAPVSAEQRESALLGARSAAAAWSAAVSRRSVDDVVAMYDPVEGKLLGTVDTSTEGVRTSPELIREYFNSFLAKESIAPVFPEFRDEDVHVLSPTLALYSGYYAFKIQASTNDKTKVANAKFSFLFQRSDDNETWKILLHNSGFTPEGLVDEE